MPKTSPDVQSILDHLASLLVNNEVLTDSLLEDIEDTRLEMIRSNQRASHALGNQLLAALGMSTQSYAEPPGGK